MIQSYLTEYGFQFGSLEVTRLASDDKKGWVFLGLKTPKTELHVYATKTGKVRVFQPNHPAVIGGVEMKLIPLPPKDAGPEFDGVGCA